MTNVFSRRWDDHISLVAGPAFQVAGGAALRTAPLSPLGVLPEEPAATPGLCGGQSRMVLPFTLSSPSLCSAAGHGLGLHRRAHVALPDANLLLSAPALEGCGPFHFSVGGSNTSTITTEILHQGHPSPASCSFPTWAVRGCCSVSQTPGFYVSCAHACVGMGSGQPVSVDLLACTMPMGAPMQSHPRAGPEHPARG